MHFFLYNNATKDNGEELSEKTKGYNIRWLNDFYLLHFGDKVKRSAYFFA